MSKNTLEKETLSSLREKQVIIKEILGTYERELNIYMGGYGIKSVHDLIGPEKEKYEKVMKFRTLYSRISEEIENKLLELV